MEHLKFKYEDIFSENEDGALTMLIPDEIMKIMDLNEGDSVTLKVTESGFLEITKGSECDFEFSTVQKIK